MKTIDFRELERHPQEGADGTERQVLAIRLKDTLDRQVVSEDGAAQYFYIERALLAQLSDPAFSAGLDDQFDIATLVQNVRTALREQFAIDDGLVVLEDNHAERVCRAVLKPQTKGYPREFVHCLLPHFAACKNPHAGDLRKSTKASRK